MQWFERHGSAGPQAPGSKPFWWCYDLLAEAHTGICFVFFFCLFCFVFCFLLFFFLFFFFFFFLFFFSPLLSSSNKHIQWIYAHRLIYLFIFFFFQLYEISIKKKNSLMIKSKPYAYLQTMTKTPVKFEKDWHKKAGVVAQTSYPVSIHVNSIQDWKMTKFKMRKKWQKWIWGLYPNHMHIFRPWQKHL